MIAQLDVFQTHALYTLLRPIEGGYGRDLSLFDLNLRTPEGEELEHIRTLLVKLDDDSYEVREAVSKELLAVGFSAEAELRKAMKEAKSAEVRIRSRRVRQELLSKPHTSLRGHTDELLGLAFSPDGKFVAYTSNESGRFEVYVETFPRSDRRWPVSTNGGYEPRWRADGREIYYLSADQKLMAVTIGAGPSFAIPKVLFQTHVPAGVHANRTHYVPTLDGRRFLINTQSGELPPNPITVVLNWTAGLKR